VYLRNHDLLCFDAGAAFCSPTAYLSYELEVDLDIPKRQAEADLGGPKNRSLMSALSRTLSIAGVDVIYWLRSFL